MEGIIRKLTVRHKRGRTVTDINRLLQMIGEIRVQVKEMKTKIETVKTLQWEILSSPSTEEEKTDNLDQLNSEINRCSIQIRTKLKVIEKSILEQEAEELKNIKLQEKSCILESTLEESVKLVAPEAGTSAKLRIHKMQYSSTLQSYSDTVNDYTEAQIEYRNQCRARLKRQLEIANATSYSEQQIEDMIDDGNFTVFTQGIISETQEAKRVLEHLKKRHTALKKLEKSIELLNDLFTDVAVCVEEQGTKVDQIVENTDKAVDQVDSANKQLEAAVAEKRKYNKRQCMIWSTLIAIILIIILVVVLSFCL